MKQPIQRYFQIGVVAAMAFPFYHSVQAPDVTDVARLVARDDDFDVIELNPIADDQKRSAVARIVQQSHLKVCYGAHARLLSAGLNPNALDEIRRETAVQALCAGVDEAEELGARGIAFLAGTWDNISQDKALAQLVKTTVQVCRYAAQKGMFVELEVFDFDIDKRALIGPAALAARFAAEVRSAVPNFGLMVDLSHFPMCYEDTAYVLRTLRPYITHFHIGNTVIADPKMDAYGDEHPRFGYPGSCNDTPEVLVFLRALQSEGFFDAADPYVLSFEVKPRPGEDFAIVLANSKRVLHRAWALLDDA